MQEEQRVIEAKIRMRWKEIQDEEERMLKRQDLGSSKQNMTPEDVECNSAGGTCIISLSCLRLQLNFTD